MLTDIRMPPTHTTEGIDAAKQIRADYPEIGVVVLSQYVEEDYAFELLADGVAGLGYLLKERVSDIDELVRALHDVARGGSALDPKVVEGLMARKCRRGRRRCCGLTDKEREVLEQMATGRNNATIATTLFMSERAVEKHIGSVFQKLGLRRRGREQPPGHGRAGLPRGHPLTCRATAECGFPHSSVGGCSPARAERGRAHCCA